jgi:hypothetical protein
MTAEDFAFVTQVKLLGAWHLYRAAKDRGLKFITALSSIVAIQGNPGQVNYCAANRSMAALMESLPSVHEGLVSKALMLPPIEGTGMADDNEVKALMARKGLASAFVHADEFAQLFCRELVTGPPRPSWVMLARTFPSVRGTRVDAGVPPAEDGGQTINGIHFRESDLPMIGSVEDLDLKNGQLVAERTFSRDLDLWIDDHKPFTSLKHPLVSGIMAVETFLEAARLLYPQLSVRGVHRLSFEDILECPPGIDRTARITCRREQWVGREIRCRATLSSADLSPSGRQLDRWSTNYQGQVLLGPGPAQISDSTDFAVDNQDLDTPGLEPLEVEESYAAHTGLTGRYRVLDRIHGTGADRIKGEMVYRQGSDMAGFEQVGYQYPPYLLEGLMHLFAFYAVLRGEDSGQELIPAGMQEMRFARLARDGERFTLEARRRASDEQGVTWDARAVDESGTPVLQVAGMRMNRFRF